MTFTEYADDSDYKYVESHDDVPITGDIDGNWGKYDIHAAVQAGEEKLEGDVNDGNEISPNNVKHIHAEAAAIWATYRLVVGMKSPDSQTRGDSLDEGSERMRFARELKSMYQETVGTIRKSGGFQSEDDDDIQFTVANW